MWQHLGDDLRRDLAYEGDERTWTVLVAYVGGVFVELSRVVEE